MSFWNEDDRSNHYSAVQGRFTLEVNIDGTFDTVVFVLGGGFWVNTDYLSMMGGWRGDIKAYLKYKNDDEPYQIFSTGVGSERTYSSVPSHALFGDGPEFTRGRTWLPMTHTRLWLESIHMQDILSGKADIMLEPGNWDLRGFGQDYMLSWYWSSLYQQKVTINRPSDAQLVITASKDILQPIISNFKSRGHAMIGLDLVFKPDFDSFWTSIFSQYGNDSAQAKLNSVLAWVSRPSFVHEPHWQSFLCLVILASVNNLNENAMRVHDSDSAEWLGGDGHPLNSRQSDNRERLDRHMHRRHRHRRDRE